MTTFLNIPLDAAALTIVLIGLIQTVTNTIIPKWSKICFTVLFSLLTVYVSCNLWSWISLIFTDNALMTQIAIFLESLFSSAVMPLLTVIMLRSCGEDHRKSPLFRVVAALFIIYCLILSATQFTTVIYYITPDNVYHRGPYYYVLLAPAVSIMIVNLIGLIIKRKRIGKGQFLAFLGYILVPMASMIIQWLFYGITVIILGSAIAALILMAVMQKYQTKQYFLQKDKIAEQHSKLAVLQMRPHFIYNTMTSIYHLCDIDPLKAQQVTLDFSTYLRKNFTAIAKNELIPFAEELEHTKAYLAVELVRFEGYLFVDFNTPHTAFRLPPLTMQPIVENAVKHGLDPELEPLHITISTRTTETGSEIIVEDTGPGFSPDDNGDPHNTLANIIERLDIMCKGTLTISDTKGGGTIVSIAIPS